ncbi:MAG: GatB/YqeY domain-containing protein [Chloroflexi bacterium]|nr:GatB/YqeY domain-containing protein [Chloroflexota bacterium]
MSIRERLEADIQAAMRSRNQQRLDALRFLKSAINRVEIDRRVTLDDDGITEVVVRQVKDRRDSIRMFEEGNRNDLVAKEAADLIILEEYMPPQLDEGEITALVEDVIRQVGAESIRDKGKVMGRLMPQVQGKADGQLVNAIVTRFLESGSPE